MSPVLALFDGGSANSRRNRIFAAPHANLIAVHGTTKMATRRVRILIADDQEIVREGARAIIEQQSGWEICGVAKTGRAVAKLVARLKPDIVIMDVNMPNLNGIDAIRQIRRQLPQTEVLIFTAHETDDLIRKVFEAGAKSFIFKSDARIHLTESIESLSRHKPFFTNRVSQVLFAEVLDSSGTPPAVRRSRLRLTARECEILQLLVEGNSNRKVAASLGISIRTAETHRAALMRKLGMDSIAGLVRYAIRNHLVEI
jgi:two-component system response regulator NreC